MTCYDLWILTYSTYFTGGMKDAVALTGTRHSGNGVCLVHPIGGTSVGCFELFACDTLCLENCYVKGC
jgi:hypothetical protein